MILDTNAVSAAMAGDLQLTRLLERHGTPRLPISVIGEYCFGLLGSNRATEVGPDFKTLVQSSVVLVCDLDTATGYANIKHQLKIAGRPIPENDIWIAALAKQHELAIVSRDRHFDYVEGVKRISW